MRRALLILLATAVVAAGVAVWWQDRAEQCVARAAGTEVALSVEQAQHAATIAAVGQREGLPRRAAVVALATAMQESKLLNLAGGDRDSAGLFQQRPSQGWGTYRQVTDPDGAAAAFYERLREVSGWQQLTITQAAQAVQHSAFPDAYAAHEGEAEVLATVFLGHAAGSFTCLVRVDAERPQEAGATGLTPRAERLRDELEEVFGSQSLGGFAPGGVQRPTPSTHEAGLAVDVFFRPHTAPAQRRHGWAVAHWLVAHADRLDVAVVIYADRIWSARRSAEGWRPYDPPFMQPDDPPAEQVVHRHLDHVHVDVVSGA